MRLAIVIFLFSLSISVFAKERVDIRSIAQAYFDVYAQRQDFNHFMTFYDDSVVLEDMVYGFLAPNKKSMVAFFNWPDPKFKAINKEALVLTNLIVDGNQVVGEGYFTEFIYDQKKLGPWRFSIKLTFNEQGKIIHQIDWINYTPRSDFLGGKNMNESSIK